MPATASKGPSTFSRRSVWRREFAGKRIGFANLQPFTEYEGDRHIFRPQRPKNEPVPGPAAKRNGFGNRFVPS